MKHVTSHSDNIGSARRKNNRMATIFVGLAIGMIGLSYAAVPLYDLFCKVTGYGGTTQRVEASDVPVLGRDITVRFNASLHRDMPWGFKPVQRTQTLKIGAQAIAYYEAFNPTKKAITGTATFNVTPHKAGPYFAKIECFCFTEQTLQPGERVDMPVVYYIDPSIAEDDDLDGVTEITLSYTFFRQEEEQHVKLQDFESNKVSLLPVKSPPVIKSQPASKSLVTRRLEKIK